MSTTTTPDFFRMSGKKLRWHAQRGPKVLREDAQKELTRRAAKHVTTPTPAEAPTPEAPVSSPAFGVTRMGDEFFAGVRMTPEMWEHLDAAVRSIA